MHTEAETDQPPSAEKMASTLVHLGLVASTLFALQEAGEADTPYFQDLTERLKEILEEAHLHEQEGELGIKWSRDIWLPLK